MAVAMKYTAAELRGERKSIASIPGKDLTHIRIQAALGVQRNSGFRCLRVVELFTGCVNVRVRVRNAVNGQNLVSYSSNFASTNHSPSPPTLRARERRFSSAPKMSDTTLTLTPGTGGGHVVTLTPPQTAANGIQVGKGAYCFVIDVSGRFVVSCALGGPRV